MDFKTLLRKHQALLTENRALKEENLSLKVRLGLAEPLESRSSPEEVQQDASRPEPSFHLSDGANPTEKARSAGKRSASRRRGLPRWNCWPGS
jgi:hypothetical protein